MTQQITIVSGPIGAGKTTYVANLDSDRYVKYCPGQIVRGLVGEHAIGSDENPNRPMFLDSLIRDLGIHAIKLGVKLEREVVMDGYPRSAQQLKDFITTRAIHKVPLFITVVALHIEEPLQVKRLMDRCGFTLTTRKVSSMAQGGEVAVPVRELSTFDKGRMVQSRKDFNEMINLAIHYENTPMANCRVALRWIKQENTE